MTKLIKIAIFDIDGCLADDEHRRHLLPRDFNGIAKDGESRQEEFDDYHEEAYRDFANNLGYETFKEVCQNLLASGDEFVTLFFTARPEKYRKKTGLWLMDNFGFGKFEQNMLYMRPNGNLYKSPVVKYKMLIDAIADYHIKGYDVEIVGAFDDRPDILNMYAAQNIPARLLNEGVCKIWLGMENSRTYRTPFGTVTDKEGEANDEADVNPYVGQEPLSEHNPEPSSPSSAPLGSPELAEIADIFEQMADTLRSRSADYGYNAAKVAKVMEVFFPNGVALKTAEDHEAWHLFELIIVKMTRFVNSGLRHKDSIHDMAIYAGFVERLVESHNIQINK